MSHYVPARDARGGLQLRHIQSTRTDRSVAARLVVALALVACVLGLRSSAASPAGDPVIGAAGDIACAPANPLFNGGSGTSTACQQGATSDALLSQPLSAVLPLGDTQYEKADPTEFAGAYDPSWGRLKTISKPAVGNHEYLTAGAQGYWSYFGAAAGPTGKGYYS